MEETAQERQPVGRVIKCLSNVLRRYLNAAFAESGLTELTGTQGMVLHYLLHSNVECITQHDIEQHFNVRGATSSKLFQRMEAAGLIERVPLSKDQRKKQLLPTQKARELDARSHACLIKTDQLLTTGISEEELEIFLHVCEQMHRNLR